ncbi:MAG: PAS domain S-box protein [Mariniphaga sp.]
MEDNDKTKEQLIEELRDIKRQMAFMEKYRSIFDNVLDAYYEATIDGTLLEISPSIETISKGQYCKEEMIGKPFEDVYENPGDRGRFFSELMRKGKLTDYELSLKNKDGSIIPVAISATVLKDADGNPGKIAGILRDITERKQSEKELIENQKVFRILNELMSEYIFKLDVQADGSFKLSVIAGNYSGATGRPVGDIKTPADWHKTIHPDDLNKVFRTLNQVLEEKEPVEVECRSFAEDGQLRWIEISATPETDKMTNQVTAIYGSVRNITSKKIAAQNLLKSEEHYRFIAERSNDLIFIYRLKPELGFDYVSPSAEKITGFTPEEHYNDPMLGMKLVHPDDRHLLQNLQNGIIQTDPYTIRWIKKDGSVIWTESQNIPIYDEKGELVAIQGRATDVTERKQAEEDLKQREEDLNYSQEIAKMGSWELNINTQKVKWSKNYYHLMGLNPSDKIDPSRYFAKIVHPDDLHLLDEKLLEIKQTKKAISADIRILMPDGQIKWVQNNIVPVFEGDKLVIFKGVNIDITDKKLAAEKIRQQNDRLHAIISAMPDLIFVIDKEGTYTEFYSSDTESLIIPVHQIVGTNLRSVFDESSARFHIENINKCIEEKKLLTYEYSIPKSDSISYYEARLAPIGSDRVLTSVRDITNRKETEFEIRDLNQNLELRIEKRTAQLAETNENLQLEIAERIKTSTALKEALDRLHKITDRIPGVVYQFRLRPDGTYCFPYVSEGIYNVLKISPEAAVNDASAIFNKIHPDDLKALYDSIFTSARNMSFWQYEYRVLSEDGAEQWLGGNSMPQPEEDGSVLWHGYISDISERKRIEVALRESEDRFSSFMDYLPAIVFLKDHEGRTLFVNRYMDNSFGASAWVGKTMLEVFPNELGERLLADDLNSLAMGYLKIEESIMQLDGKLHDYETQKFTIGRQGQKPWLGGISLDITDRKLAEAEIIEARNEAEKANQAKSEFLSRMSHELRTPMNSILGFAQLLQMGDLNPRQKAGVDHILNSGKHLLNLINEVLDIARIESGKVTILREPIQIQDIIAEMMDLVHPAIVKQNQTIEFIESPVNQLFVISDRQRLRQVLLNLINNAIKYNCPKGTVTIKAGLCTNEENGVSFIRISITDTGWGISPEDQYKLFKPFERIGAEKTETEGTGLGLAVVKKLMDAMDGNVGVKSNIGAGSTFWIELPQSTSLGEPVEKISSTSTLTTKVADKAGTILYIEDNVSNIELVAQILSSLRPDIRLISNKNGRLAVPLAIEHSPDLILLDLDLPDIHGVEVLGILKRKESVSRIPVVIISADAMPQQLEKLMKAGAENYLTKPLDVEIFLSVVDQWIGKER